MAEAHELSITDASNTTRFPEGQAPSTVNNGARALEGMIARWYFDTNFSVEATLSGTVIQATLNRTSITLTGTTSNYVANLLVCLTVGANALVGPCSVRLNDIQTLSLRDEAGSSLSATFAPSGGRIVLVKDHANNYFRLLSGGGQAQGRTFLGHIRLNGYISPAQITSDQNDYNPTGLASCSVLRVNDDQNGRKITGIVAPASGGQTILLMNVGSFTISLPQEDTNSSAANRFFGTNGTAPTLTAKRFMLIHYDETLTRWVQHA